MSIEELKEYLFNLSENLDNYEYFLEELRRGNCVALVGAGLSKQVELPTWEELVFDLCEECHIANPKEEILSGQKELYDIAQEIKDSLSQSDYLKILRKKLTPPNMDYGETHLSLLKANFCSFLTTNYDDGLERAAAGLSVNGMQRNIQVYPILDQTLLKQRTVFYLHGKIHEGVIVFARNDYERAYGQHKAIESVLWDAYSQMNIVILCCSFEDKYMIELFEKCKRELDKQNVASQELIGLRRIASSPGKHFILKGLQEDNDTEETMKKDQTSFQGINIRPIFYKVPKGGSHRNLKTLLGKLPKYKFKKERIEVKVTYEA